MKLSQTWKVIIGLLTLGVVLYPLLFIFIFFIPFFSIIGASNGNPSPFFFGAFFLIFPIIFLMSFVQVGMSIFYLVHIIKNTKGSEILRILCGVGAFYMPFFAMPAYYLIYIWPKPPPDWALLSAPPRRAATRRH